MERPMRLLAVLSLAMLDNGRYVFISVCQTIDIVIVILFATIWL